MFWLRFWFWCATIIDSIKSCVAATKRCVFNYCITRYSPQSMYYLQNGQWVFKGPHYSPETIKYMYSAKKHMIETPQGRREGRTARWPWLGVVERHRKKEMTDFFSGLRVQVQESPSIPIVLALFSHQKGWMPQGPLDITTRMGDEIVINT